MGGKNPFTGIIQSIFDLTKGSKLSHILLGWEWDAACKDQTTLGILTGKENGGRQSQRK